MTPLAHHRPFPYAGGSCSAEGIARLRQLGWGQCWSEGPYRKTPPLPWFMDNGAWEAFCKGEAFPEAAFLRRVERCYDRGFVPDFVVLPDVVGDFSATLDLSGRWTSRLPATWRLYLALQDGATAWRVADFVKGTKRVGGLFLGGTPWFKDEQAFTWAEFAHGHGLKFHYARAGTPRKFAHAMLVGADSLDSSRLSRSWRDFYACRKLWLDGPPPRLFADHRKGVA